MRKALSIITALALMVGLASAASFTAFAAETVKVSSASQLKDTVSKINSGELGEDTNITLTADIDLTDIEGWKPLKSYSGTFDGAGFAVKNLSHSVTIANNDADKLDGGSNTAEYVIARENDGLGSGCYGQVGIALLVVKSNGATLKNFTLKDSKLNVAMNFNKNWQPFYGGVVAYMNGGSISGVKLENVDLTVDNQSAINQGFLGFAGLMAGVTMGKVTIDTCSINADCTLDASANKKFDVAAYVGRHSSESPITVTNCSTAATVKAAADVSNKDGLMYNADDAQLGGWAAAIVARFNDSTVDGARDTLTGCTNTGNITGAHVNADNLLVGDLNNTRTDIVYEDQPANPGEEGDNPGEEGGNPGEETNPPQTGDAAAFISAVAIVSLLGAAVVVSKKRTYNR